MTDYSNIFGSLYVPVTVQGHSFDLDDVQMNWGAFTAEIEIVTNTEDYVSLLGSYSGGVGPYSVQWFRGTTPYFVMDSTTLIESENNIQLVVENTSTHYYRMRVTDGVYTIVNSNILEITPPSPPLVPPATVEECVATRTYFCGVDTATCAANAVVKRAYVPAITVCSAKNRINFNLI